MKFTSGTVLTVAMATALATAAFAGEKDYKHASVQAEMRAMDVNQDGKISASEHAAGAQQMFQSMDGNQDNRVTAPEMDEAQKPMKAVDASHGERKGTKMSHEISSAEKIKTIDADGDGVLTAEEHAAGSRKMFAKMDTNKDGYLTSDEISAGHAKMMAAEDR